MGRICCYVCYYQLSTFQEKYIFEDTYSYFSSRSNKYKTLKFENLFENGNELMSKSVMLFGQRLVYQQPQRFRPWASKRSLFFSLIYCRWKKWVGFAKVIFNFMFSGVVYRAREKQEEYQQFSKVICPYCHQWITVSG